MDDTVTEIFPAIALGEMVQGLQDERHERPEHEGMHQTGGWTLGDNFTLENDFADKSADS